MELLQATTHALTVGVVFLLVLTVLVAVHELGHYWFAKMCGMHVEAFAVMVGGIRKTDLSGRLARSLAPGWMVWTVGVAASIVTALGSFFEVRPVFYVGMGLLTVVGPLWVIGRLSALYHRPLRTGLLTLAKSWGVVAAILFLGTQFRGLELGYALSMFLGGSAVAVLLVYYAPVLGGADMEGNKGRGSIEVAGETVPVRFRPLLSRTNKEGTEFSLLLLPLGGFAAIKGMQPREDGSETRVERGFFSRPPWQRLLVLFAGPLFSVLFGVVLAFVSLVAHGRQEMSTLVSLVAADGAAKQAGLVEGDRILRIAGEPVTNFFELTEQVRFAYEERGGELVGRPLEVVVSRNGEERVFTVTPRVDESASPVLNAELEPTGEERRQAKLGVGLSPVFVPMAPGEAAVESLLLPVRVTQHVGAMFTSIEVARQSVGGPAAMVESTSMAVQSGFWATVMMAASLSVVLGIMNLLPIPPLDGGQMVIAFIEMVRGNKRLSLGLQAALHNVGAALVMLLMLAAITLDASRRSESARAEDASRGAVESPERAIPAE